MSLEINYEDYLNIFLSNVVFVDQAVPLDLDVIAINIQKMIIDRDGIVTHQDIRTMISDPEPGKALNFNYNMFDTKQSHEKLLLTVIHELSFGVAEVRGFIDGISKKLDNVVVGEFIFIYQKKVTKNAKSELLGFIATREPRPHKDVHVSYFSKPELVVPYPEHELVPRHIRVPEAEYEQLLKRLCVKRENMPILLIDDPISRWYGFRKGEIIQIIRRFGGCNQEELFYRIVSR